jgi:hypothetical protein
LGNWRGEFINNNENKELYFKAIISKENDVKSEYYFTGKL